MQHNLNILIVEDDFIISADLQLTLENMGYNANGICASAEEALDYLKNNPVDFAIFDINLKGETDGIELAGLVARHYQIPFVFLTTLMDQEFVDRAKQVKPYAYMLKPFNQRQLQIAVEMAISNFSAGKEAQVNQSLTEKANGQKTETSDEDDVLPPVKGAIFLKKNQRFVKVRIEEIFFVEADGNYTIVHTTQGDFLYAFVLKKIEVKLPSETFARVHRSYLVNVNHVNSFSGNLITVNGHDIPVSKNHQSELFSRFEQIK